MNKKTKIKWIIIAVLFLIIIIAAYFYFEKKWIFADKNNNPINEEPSNALEVFAQCLKDKGAVFYGSEWCSHCNNQKAMFGSAAGFLPYVECSTSNGMGEAEICVQNNIEAYPTWVFADGLRETGEMSFSKLAEKTGCTL